jgi:hypothetical protein
LEGGIQSTSPKAPPVLNPPLDTGVKQTTSSKPVVKSSATGISLDGSGFFYPADFSARYLTLRSEWRLRHPGQILTLDTLQTLSQMAYDPAPDKLRPLKQWALRGGLSPWVFRPVLQVHNKNGNQALLDLDIEARLAGTFTQLYVHPQTLLVDPTVSDSKATEEALFRDKYTIKALAPNEETRVPLPPIPLLRLLAERPRLWPSRLVLRVVVRHQGQVLQQTEWPLVLIPDHFALPFSLY